MRRLLEFRAFDEAAKLKQIALPFAGLSGQNERRRRRSDEEGPFSFLIHHRSIEDWSTIPEQTPFPTTLQPPRCFFFSPIPLLLFFLQERASTARRGRCCFFQRRQANLPYGNVPSDTCCSYRIYLRLRCIPVSG